MKLYKKLLFLLLLIAVAVAIFLFFHKKQEKKVILSDNLYSTIFSARQAYQYQDYERAEKFYLHALELQKNLKHKSSLSILINNEYIKFLVSSYQMEKAMEYINSLNKKTISKIEIAKEVLTIKYIKEHNTAVMKKQYEKIKDNKQLRLYDMMNEIAMAWIHGENKDMVSVYRTLRKYKNIPEIYNLSLAYIFANMEDYNRSLMHFEELFNKKAIYRHNMMTYLNLLYKLGRDKEAIQNYKKVYEEKVTDEQIKKYIQNENSVISLNALLSSIFSTISAEQSNLKQIQIFSTETMTLLRIPYYAIEFNKNNNFAHTILAKYLIFFGDIENAIRIYSSIPKNSYDYTLIYDDYAALLEALGQFKAARRVLKLMSLEEKDNSASLVQIALSFSKENKHHIAIGILGDSIKSAKQNYNTLMLAFSYFIRASEYNKLKKWDLAEKDLKMALKVDHSIPQVQNYLAYSWVERDKNIKQSIVMLKSLVKKFPTEPNYLDSYAWALFKNGQYEKAQKYEEMAIHYGPFVSKFSDHLGDIYWKLGKRKEAMFEWKTAINLIDIHHMKNNYLDFIIIKNKLDGLIPSYLKTDKLQKKQAFEIFIDNNN